MRVGSLEQVPWTSIAQRLAFRTGPTERASHLVHGTAETSGVIITLDVAEVPPRTSTWWRRVEVRISAPDRRHVDAEDLQEHASMFTRALNRQWPRVVTVVDLLAVDGADGRHLELRAVGRLPQVDWIEPDFRAFTWMQLLLLALYDMTDVVGARPSP